MKRIILNLSVLLILVQNGLAKTDAEYDKIISKQTSEIDKNIIRCNKMANNHPSTASINICKDITIFIEKNYPNEIEIVAALTLNTATMYYYHGDKLKAYKYNMKAAKLGNITAQDNLNTLCKESPWACK